jgi:hypothetical protein
MPGGNSSVCQPPAARRARRSVRVLGSSAENSAILEEVRATGDGWRYGESSDPDAPQPGDPPRGRGTPQPFQTWLQPFGGAHGRLGLRQSDSAQARKEVANGKRNDLPQDESLECDLKQLRKEVQ